MAWIVVVWMGMKVIKSLTKLFILQIFWFRSIMTWIIVNWIEMEIVIHPALALPSRGNTTPRCGLEQGVKVVKELRKLLQDCTERLFPGCVNMGWKNCSPA